MANSRQPQNQRIFTSCAQEGVYPTIKIEDDGTTTMEYSNSLHLQTSQVLLPSHSQSYSNSHTPLTSLAQLTSPLNSEPVAHAVSNVQVESGKIVKKQDRWIRFEEDTLNQLYSSRKAELRFKPHFAPAWVKLVEDLQQACKDHGIACDKSARQCKNKLNYMTKKSKRESGVSWRNTSSRVSHEDEGSENDAEEANYDQNTFNSPLNDQESVDDSRNTPQSVEENSSVQPSPVQLLPPMITNASTRNDEHFVIPVRTSASSCSEEQEQTLRKTSLETTPDELNISPCSECNCKRKARADSSSSEVPMKVVKLDELERIASDKRQMIEFLEKSQKKYEDILLKYAEIEKQRTEMHLKFTLDAMNMMAQTLKDMVNNQN